MPNLEVYKQLQVKLRRFQSVNKSPCRLSKQGEVYVAMWDTFPDRGGSSAF
jgi:hypothetical protein